MPVFDFWSIKWSTVVPCGVLSSPGVPNSIIQRFPEGTKRQRYLDEAHSSLTGTSTLAADETSIPTAAEAVTVVSQDATTTVAAGEGVITASKATTDAGTQTGVSNRPDGDIDGPLLSPQPRQFSTMSIVVSVMLLMICVFYGLCFGIQWKARRMNIIRHCLISQRRRDEINEERRRSSSREGRSSEGEVDMDDGNEINNDGEMIGVDGIVLGIESDPLSVQAQKQMAEFGPKNEED